MKCILPLALTGLTFTLGLAGCGGSSGSSAAAPVESENTFGQITTRAIGGVKAPVTMQATDSTVTGVYGANFTNIAFQMPASSNFNASDLDLSQSVFAMSYANLATMMDVGSGKVVRIDPTITGRIGDCATNISPSFDKVVVAQGVGGWAQLITMNLDGTARTLLPTTGSVDYSDPCFNAALTKIAYSKNGDIFTANINGSGEVNLTNSASTIETGPKFSPDGQRIACKKSVPGGYEVWEMPATGGAATKIYPVSVKEFDYSPSGQHIAAVEYYNPYYYLESCTIATQQRDNYLITTDLIDHIEYSPNAAFIAYQQHISGNPVMAVDTVTKKTRLMLNLPDYSYLDDWISLPRKRTFVGASGAVLHTNAAGFLYGMNNYSLQSLVAFDSTDRVNTQIDVPAQSGTQVANFIATVTTSGQLNMLRFVNGYIAPKVTVIEPTNAATFAKGAIITFNTANGQVMSILPFTSAKAAPKQTRSKSGDLVEIEGEFLGVYDQEGKKTVTNATLVTVDPKDGHVVSVR